MWRHFCPEDTGMGVSTEKMSTLLARGKCRCNFALARLAKMKTGGHQQVLVSTGQGGGWNPCTWLVGFQNGHITLGKESRWCPKY